MDNIVQPNVRCWISGPIVLREYMEQLLKTSLDTGFTQKFDKDEADRLKKTSDASELNLTPEPPTDEEKGDAQRLKEAVEALKEAIKEENIEEDNNEEEEFLKTMGGLGGDAKAEKESQEQDDDDETFPRKDDKGENLETPQDLPDTFNEWLDKGVKSGPHRLLSGETKFSSFMERAFAEKANRDLGFAEEFRDKHMSTLGIDLKKFKKLQKETSAAFASVRGESFKDDPIIEGIDMPVLIPPIPDADKIELKSLGVLLCGSNPTGPIWRSNNVQQQINDNLKFVAKKEKFQRRLEDYADDSVRGLVDNTRDFLIEVSIFGCRNPDESLPSDVKLYTEPKLIYNLHLLGTNTVVDLQNGIHCENELLTNIELEHPDHLIHSDDILKYQIPSWAIMIGDQIFGEGTDVAAALTKWINEEPQKKLGPFQRGLNHTMLQDLTLRFGYPYSYSHIGKCEHIIVFNQARAIQPHDEHRIRKYPVIGTIPNVKNVYCRVDNENMATWMVVDCEQFPENPMYICTTCLKTFCYNHNGKKRLPFRLFRYRQLSNEI